MKIQIHQMLFLAAAAILLMAIIFGFATQTDRMSEHATAHGTVYVGGGPIWYVFERGLIFGDGALSMEQGREEMVGGQAGHNYSFTLPSPLENSLMWSSTCSANRMSDPMDEITGRAECGRSIRWVDVSNPTPFMLAALLCGIGAYLRKRRTTAKQATV